MGVDFNPYLSRVLHDVKQHWYELIPKSAGQQRGKVVLRFAILKDGSVAGLQIEGSSGDIAMDRPAYGSIAGSNPFPPLPTEFKGPYIGLRFSFYYNVDPTDGNQGSRSDSVQSTGRSAGDDGAFAISPSGPMNVTAGSAQQFSATASSAQAVTWTLGGIACAKSDCGSISPSGGYTAPVKVPDPPDITVTATQTSAPFKSVSVRITIIAPSAGKELSP